MAVFVACALALSGVAFLAADGAVLERFDSINRTSGIQREKRGTRAWRENLEAQMIYDLTGEAAAPPPAGIVRKTPRWIVRPRMTPLMLRPLVVLKLARTGSSWFADELEAAGEWPKVKPEATNNHEWCRHELRPTKVRCDAMATDVMRYLKPKFGGLTINPFKFDCARPDGGGCFDALWNGLAKFSPIVIVLARKNVVLQAAAKLRAKGIIDAGICDHGFHVDLCSAEASSFRVDVRPHKLLRLAKKALDQARMLRILGRRLTLASDTLEVHTEDFFDYEDRTFAVPQKVWKFLKLDTRIVGYSGEPIETLGGAEMQDNQTKDNNTILMNFHKTMLDSVHQAVDYAVGVNRTHKRRRSGAVHPGEKTSSKSNRRNEARSSSRSRHEKKIPLLRNYISNYGEVRRWFQKHAVNFVKLVEAVDGTA